jgi:hypothetical protein
MQMQKAWMLSCCLVVAVAFGGVLRGQESQQPLTVRERKPLVGPQYNKAPEKPPEDFQAVMKGNNTIMSVDGRGGEGTGTGSAAAGGFVLPGTLSTNLAEGETQNWEAAAKDAATLKANFAQIEAFFVGKKDEDAMDIARQGVKFVTELEQSIAKKERVAAVKAQIGIAETCRECHIGHRVLVLTTPQTFGIV